MNDSEILLVEELGEYAYDPLGFVMWAFPWGEPGELVEETGPDDWQKNLLTMLGEGIITLDEAFRAAASTGHGVGKSAIGAWLTLWAMSTYPGTRGVVTANTENQLKTKTWVELAKWHRLFIASHLFKCTATAIFSVDPSMAREWRIDIVPWSEKNTEAFAGLHNAGKRIFILFDEASAIPDIIWETTEGAMSDKDTEIIWIVFGNPTRNTGRFRECFGDERFAKRWNGIQVDSRTVKRTNKQQLNQWIEDYGLDSDFVRVRILGQFPREDSSSFISLDLAKAAVNRQLPDQSAFPIVLGVDVARHGKNASVIYPRQGRDASTRRPEVYYGLDVVQLAAKVTSAYIYYRASAVFVDVGGVGGGVYDILLHQGIPVYPVDFGSRADGYAHGVSYGNKRSEIWGWMKDFLSQGSIPDEIPGLQNSLIEEMIAPGYSINAKQQIMLESKELMRTRGVVSPDGADALAITGAYPDIALSSRPTEIHQDTEYAEYSPFASV